jgi:5'-nucleotidase
VFEPGTDKPLCGCIDHIILEHQGIKIGILGLAELEWLDTIIHLTEDDYDYEDFIKSAIKWVKKLKSKGAEIIIALTHLRLPNDK